MQITKQEELKALREGGKILANVINEVAKAALPGISTQKLDIITRELISNAGGKPAFLNYTPEGAGRPFPGALCSSVNEEVVHGIPNEDPRVLRDGDIVTLDAGLEYKGFFTDMAVTVPVGVIDTSSAKLISTAREALSVAIKTARPGSTTGDIGAMVEAVAKRFGFSTPHDLGGHGVGRAVHEAPFIPNFGSSGSGEKLTAGMVLAIEPIVIAGGGDIVLSSDGYTYKSKDGTRSAQFEHTVLITDDEAEILTAV